VKALRATMRVPEERRRAFREAVFRAYWADDRDISDDAVLGELLGPDRDVLAQVSDPEVKAALVAATQEAVDRGVFGAPTFVVDGELFWGQDRLELVEERLVRAR
jgi:2-hydroxychromene-2-carboxylate isomerase